MQILDIKIDWGLGFCNSPRLKLLVDRIPKLDELRFREKKHCYFAELDGFVWFFHYDGPGDGYGGAVFNITMEDGSEKACKGPWSSRSGVMNRLEFAPCLECAMTSERDVWKRGHTFWGRSVSVEAVERALPNIAIDMAFDREVERDGEIYFRPTLRGLGWREAKQFMFEQRFGFRPDGSRFGIRREPWAKGGWKTVEIPQPALTGQGV